MRKILIISLFAIYATNDGQAQLRLTDIAEKYAAYQTIWARTKLHLVFNQEKYSTGDTIFFKAYFLKEDLTRLRGKQLIEVHLVNDQGQSPVHLRFHVHNGLGFNQLIIPDGLKAGVYNIIAYNNWMRNFDPAYFFKKKITIVKKKEVAEVQEKFLRIAPEGGKLIAGISNKLGIYTHHAEATLQIKDETGQEIIRVTTDRNGTASIQFTPVEGLRYKAFLPDDNIQIDLPAVEREGVSAQLIEGSNNLVKVMLTSPESSMYRGKELYIVVTCRGKILYSTTRKHNARDTIQIMTSNFPDGLMKFSLLERSGKVLASRDFYHDRKGVIINLHPDQSDYVPRQKVRMEISISDPEGKPLAGEFSIRAINAGLFDSTSFSFRDELTIFSELKLPPFQYAKTNWYESLDNMLIVNTEPVPWSAILSSTPASPTYAYTNVIEKKGKAFDGLTNQPLPDYTQILFYLQKDQTYYQTFTMDNGKMALTLQDFYGEDEFFYLAKVRYGEEIDNVKVIWEKDSVPLPKAPLSIEKESPDRYANFIERKQLIDQSFDVHSKLNNANITGSQEYKDDLLEADITVNLEEYVVFPTMHDVIKEVVSGMYSRKSKKGDIVRVDLMPPLIGSSNPVYIIDGFVTKNTEYFLSLKPSELKTLKVVNNTQKLIPTGLLGQFGIVMVESRLGNLGEPLRSDNKRINGLQLPVKFSEVGPVKGDTQSPDFRSTVYWNPSIKTDEMGKAMIEFNLSDDVGVINVLVDGITGELTPFSASTSIKVEIKRSGQ